QLGLSPPVLDRLAEEYGSYDDARRVVNKRVFSLAVPGGLFRNALTQGPRLPSAQPLLQVAVHCEDDSHYLGVARYDLYLLEAEGWFAVNFLKGAAGLWFRLCWVIGVALACSTYLSGVVSWLSAMFLYGAGVFQEFLQDMALGTRIGTSAE